MRRRIEIEDLRTSDPSTLQVLAEDAIRRPLGQIAPATVADLMALSELPDLPRALHRGLAAFAERMPREIADLPDGVPWAEFVDEYGALAPARVPACLRACVAREAARDDRDVVGRARAAEVVARWESAAPETISLPTAQRKRPVVLPAAPAPDEDASSNRRGPAAPRVQAPREPKPVTAEDAQRRAWIRRSVVERLADYSDSGLGEAVLVAGTLHRAREEHPDLAAHDVMDVLREMKGTGQIRQSAGRWKLISRW